MLSLVIHLHLSLILNFNRFMFHSITVGVLLLVDRYFSVVLSTLEHVRFRYRFGSSEPGVVIAV